jgi:lipoprotein-anchoring transpeptidase ErfK/SrfK
MPRSWLVLLLVGLHGFVLAGCAQGTLAPSSSASLTPRDRQLLAQASYTQATIPESYRRHFVDYSRKEAPGSILVDTDARYLYYVLPGGQSDPLRRGGGRGGDGLLRRRQGRPYGGMA